MNYQVIIPKPVQKQLAVSINNELIFRFNKHSRYYFNPFSLQDLTNNPT